jgi:iron complex outermembrane receptor protein
MRWQPFDEQLTLRATWGEGFREPSLEELYSAPLSSLEVTHDINPITGAMVFESETNVLIFNNPDLQPEDSRSFSGGFVYTPKYVPGLTFATDFWDIERTGVVFHPRADDVLARERAGNLLPGEAVERDAGGFITRILIPNQNVASQTARGVDFELQYQRQTPWGVFTSWTQTTYLHQFFFPQFADGNLAGDTTNEGLSDEGYYRWKGDSRLNWTWKGFDINVTAHYIDGFHEHQPGALRESHWVKASWLFDGQASYDFTALLPVDTKPVPGYAKDAKDIGRGKDGRPTESAFSQTSNYTQGIFGHLLRGTIITIGCNNIFGQDPPHAFGEGGNAVGYPGFTYDATGRFVYVRLTKRF